MFIPAFWYKTDRLTDISYAVSFAVLALISFMRSDKAIGHVLLLVAVMTWSVRLGGFLLYRVWRNKKDKRFDVMRESFWLFLRFWVLQALTVFVVLLPSLLLFRTGKITANLMSAVGLFIFSVGLLLESIADFQKFRFGRNPANKYKWIESGVWRVSRHPNYLGEMMVWTGVYIYAYSSLSSGGRILGLLSPVYIICLLLFGSGIPILEKYADSKWGSRQDYIDYKKRTPVLLPSIIRK